MTFDYKTVDVPVLNGHVQLDVVVSHMGQEGWRPVTLIPPHEAYPHNSIVFEKEMPRYA